MRRLARGARTLPQMQSPSLLRMRIFHAETARVLRLTDAIVQKQILVIHTYCNCEIQSPVD